MGLSTKQVSSDGHGWNQALLQDSNNLELPKLPIKRQSLQQQQQPQQQPPEALKCPRCDSSNTKFCYYNNYNKLQPRHFCKSCKRHWTKGGTLRNVPVGGGRKNKRKASKIASKTTTTSKATQKLNSATTSATPNTMLTQQQPPPPQPVAATIEGVHENPPNFMHQSINDQNIQFLYSNLGDFENNPCSISSTITSNQSPNLYNYTAGEANSLEETVMNSISLSSSSMSDHQLMPWSMVTTTTTTTTSSSAMDISTNLGWGDFDKFVSVDADDLTIPWDDPEIKPAGS